MRMGCGATGIELVSMGSRQGVVYDVDWSGDGTRLVAAYEGGLVTVWDALTGAAIFTVDSGGTSANASAYAPDGQTFAAGTNDGSVVLWDAVTGTQLAIFSGHENTVFAGLYGGQPLPAGAAAVTPPCANGMCRRVKTCCASPGTPGRSGR
ncbi:MAG: hypothetical protein IPO91_05720 [Chloroflexi bacterium]|nr:hypothetical protein [Chloroflexota bacterium]